MSKLNNWCATFRLDIFVGCRLHTGGKWYFMLFYIIVLYWIFQNIVPPCAGWDHTFWLPAFKSPHIRVFFCQFHPIFVHVKQSILIWTQNSESLKSVWGNLVNRFLFGHMIFLNLGTWRKSTCNKHTVKLEWCQIVWPVFGLRFMKSK